MVKKKEWFSVVKKALTPQCNKDPETSKLKSKLKWPSKSKDSGPREPETQSPKPLPAKVAEAENEDKRHAHSLDLATAMAAETEAAPAAKEAPSAASVNRISSEKIAATRIQSAFRGYLVRRELRGLRRSMRLKSLIQGQSIERQTATTLRCMQTLARLQSQVRARRLRMSEENRILQHQLQQKQEKEVDKFNDSVGEWNDSRKSKEESEAIKQNRQEAAMRRERALAYAFSHQRSWKVSSKGENETSMDPNNPHWGWSWLERWMAARPWEIPNSTPNGSLNTVAASSILNECKPSATPPRRSPARRSLSTSPSNGLLSNKVRLPSRDGNDNSKLDRHRRRHSSIESLSPLKRNGMSEKRLTNTAKKRYSLPVSPGKSMKQSGPRMTNTNSSVKDVKVNKSKN